MLKLQLKELYEQEKFGTEEIGKLCTNLSRLSLTTRDFEQELLIIASLDYEDRKMRHEKIPEAHRTTFGWGLNEVADGKEQFVVLRRWLPTTDGLFWVSGKPGSGKSTFMKFIADHDTTRRYLRQWAGSRELLIASHYFTIYGTPVQRSLEGLLRSLLYDVFRIEPKIIPKLVPSRWNTESAQPPWTQLELESVLRLVVAETAIPVSICFFIDGLDEYTGDHWDICRTLRDISQAPFIKICASSRPWNVFKDALGDTPNSTLYMHELTYEDIHNYTDDLLRGHPRWTALEEETSLVTSESLIVDIVEKSNGVFFLGDSGRTSTPRRPHERG